MGSVYEDFFVSSLRCPMRKVEITLPNRDVVKLLVSFVFGGDKQNLLGEGKVVQSLIPVVEQGGC